MEGIPPGAVALDTMVAATVGDRQVALCGGVNAAEIDGEHAVDEHPHVVATDEPEVVVRGCFVLEPVTDFAGEAEVVRDGGVLDWPH